MKTETKKAKAIELMKKLNIHKPYIDGFEQKDLVCFFENFGGFWDYQEPEIEAKRKWLEAKYKCVVYAITHEFVYGDEMYSFLMVTDYKGEWRSLLMSAGKRQYYAMTYTWNKSHEDSSEFGSIIIQSSGGGIRRIG